MPRKEHLGRAVTVYASSDLEREEWLQEAKAAGVNLSKWICEMIYRTKNAPKRSSQISDSTDLQAELTRLHQKLEIKDLLLERQQTELVKLRDKVFLREKLSGVVKFDNALIKLLKRRQVLNSDKILSALYINPSDSDATKIIMKQLQELQAFGLVEEGPRGWRWIK